VSREGAPEANKLWVNVSRLNATLTQSTLLLIERPNPPPPRSLFSNAQTQKPTNTQELYAGEAAVAAHETTDRMQALLPKLQGLCKSLRLVHGLVAAETL
jgi:hypothetical protein